MGHISEPKNIDFIIESPPLSDKERRKISEFIEKLKKKKNRKSTLKQKKKKRPANQDG
ncbi:MAG: hypothetical protein WD048_06630 [Chitinophagales bacterium]